MSCKSGIDPLQLGFNNITLLTDGSANSHGIAIQVGTPGQIISVTPSTLANNTILTNRERCISNANTSCISVIGGGFDASASSTFTSTTLDAWNGSLENPAYYDALVNVPATYFNDDLSIGANQKSNILPGFPLLLATTTTSFYSQLGIGANSTFINRVVEAGLAPSRSWSFFAGIYSSVRAGLLIVGGTADRFYEGILHTKNATDESEGDIFFRVSDMIYQENGRNYSLMPDGVSDFVAFIDPFYPTMAVPNGTLSKFGNATKGTYLPLLGLYNYSSDALPTGSITVTLENNLTTTIPNEALFDPPGYDNGILSVYRNGSTSYSLSLVSSWTTYLKTAPSTDIAIFGMPYAAFVYLSRDYERNTVSIANANQDASIGGDITPICSPNDVGHSSSNHTGAIVGGVVGGVVGLALIAFLAWFFLRRKKRAAAPAAEAESKDPDTAISEAPPADSKAELATSGTLVGNRTSVEKPAAPVEHRAEMSNETSLVEMPGTQTRPPTELPAREVKPTELPA